MLFHVNTILLILAFVDVFMLHAICHYVQIALLKHMVLHSDTNSSQYNYNYNPQILKTICNGCETGMVV